jgi:undecaprenyl-diphosphatase
MDIALIFSFYFVDSPQWQSKWRTIGRVVLFCAVLARLGAGLVNPWTIALVVSVAFVAAQLLFFAFGIVNTRPHASDVARMLERFGFPLASIRRVPHFTDFTGYLAETKSGQMLFAKIVSREDWTAFLPVRLYRAVRFRDVGEARPFTKLRHRAEHEALASLKALGDGVSTPQLLFVSEYQANSMALVFETPKVQQAATVLDEQPSRELLASLWRIVEKLRAGHTVHRRLNSDTIILDESGEPLVIDFSSAELGVTGPALSIDVAELLAASAARVGVETAVEVAADTIGTAPLGEAISRLQPLALTKPTRHAVQQAKCLDDLRAQVQLVSGVESVPLVQLERVKPQSIMMVVMSGVALWSLIPQFAGFGSVWGKFASANWWWIVGALGLSALTYVAAAIALSGSTTERLPLAPNVGVQLATSFVGVAAPGGAFVLAGRFLQRRGLDAARASAAIAVDTVAGVVVHLILTGLFIALAGTSGLKTFSLPSLSTIGIFAAGLVAAVLLAFVVPKIRELAREHLLPAVQRAAGGVRGVAQRPSKMVELFGGSVGITLGYVFALEMSVLALGGGPSFTSVALVYLVGSVVSSVAPTPGGIGAVEATLIAGLTSAGMTSATAIAAVLLFRLATFWLPLLPGWGALAVLQRSGDL